MNWDVLLHGNPAVDLFNGLKLAAGGELGIGVGEEDWGSGEREVLEDFIGRTDGLIDLVVSRFGDVAPGDHAPSNTSKTNEILSSDGGDGTSWLGAGASPRSSDGVIFSGIGAIGRSSIKDISGWMELIYMHGQDAYAILENPSNHRRKRRKVQVSDSSQRHSEMLLPGHDRQSQNRSSSAIKDITASSPQPAKHLPGIPRPVFPVRQESTNASTRASAPKRAENHKDQNGVEPEAIDSMFNTDTMIKYLTLGIYGSSWGIPSMKTSATSSKAADTSHQDSEVHTANRKHDTDAKYSMTSPNVSTDAPKIDTSCGSFLIGLQGDPEGNMNEEQEGQDNDVLKVRDEYAESSRQDSRVMLRTIHIERIKRSDKAHGEHEQVQFPPDHFDSSRVVVYVVSLKATNRWSAMLTSPASTFHLHLSL